ncbi:MAG TPA: rhomboid family intramembrane serine protease [Urbifossiella sp.]|nr:rhomboid family intramembrane serine protease [Urbifossiella sp.]
MGLYSRDYYREISGSVWGFEGASVVKYVIIANVVVFLLQIFIVRPPQMTMKEYRDAIKAKAAEKEKAKAAEEEYEPSTYEESMELIRATQRTSVVQEWCALDTDKVINQGQVWRLLTHAFCHDRMSVFHLLFNMIGLYWFGRTVEIMYGSREFLLFYLAAALIAALAFVGLDLYTGSRVPAVGASGAVMAVLMLYTVHFPRETVCCYWFISLEMRWLMALYVIWDLHPVLLALAGDRVFSGIGHAAHLGGLAFGFAYGWYQWRLEPILDRVPWVGAQAPARPQVRPLRSRYPAAEPAAATSDYDRVLEKISRSGRESLTEEELAVLRTASEKLKTRARGG